MTSREVRSSFLDFFRSKQHTIVPSSRLLPDSPNLLFTNAGMNQFVPIFLGQQKCPYAPARVADTQKCIRAGGKHNDLEDVGLDTYHHTFFEMLGNWSFGDYFKKEAIEWAWELVAEVWKFPKHRIYATVYSPDKSKGEPADRDQEACQIWSELFRRAGLDPQVHIVFAPKEHNFWMMGETGPCGPCSEIHVDLSREGNSRGSLVNQGSSQCIEIWNLVFIQFNANPDGTFTPLPARHVDTGLGLERVTAIIQGTQNFQDFNRALSNYETDIFRPLFDRLEQLSGKRYGSTLPQAAQAMTAEEKIDVAFRVIADHIRTLGFAIADGVLPGNTDRHYVLRRVLRRAVRYGRSLGFHEPFFYKLVEVLAETMGDVFPEIRSRRALVQATIKTEEDSFNKTLDRGIELFREESEGLDPGQQLSGAFAFKLYDTYGFPLDLTELMAREAGLAVDTSGFKQLMEQQRARARAAQKKETIALSDVESGPPTVFVGYDQLLTPAKVLEVLEVRSKPVVVLDRSCCYAEMGGQVGDTGELRGAGKLWPIANTIKSGETFLHFLTATPSSLPESGCEVQVAVDAPRRAAIQRHHTVTHLFHWALHEVVGPQAAQKGSYVGPEKLTFDFNSAPLTAQQVRDIEKIVNERIVENSPVFWTEVPYSEVKERGDILQFFGEKYAQVVRVVQIGGRPAELNGYSMELCGGTHTHATGEIGLFRIISESAIAAGIRRVEAIAGLAAYEKTRQETELLGSVAEKINAPAGELERKLENLLAQQKQLEKQLKALQQRQAAEMGRQLISRAQMIGTTRAIIENLGQLEPDFLQAIAEALKGEFNGVVVLGAVTDGAVALVATVSPELTGKVQAGKIIQAIAPIVGGKGGGRPEQARGGGKEPAKLSDALAKVASLL